jgi:serine/threonine protein kinase
MADQLQDEAVEYAVGDEGVSDDGVRDAEPSLSLMSRINNWVQGMKLYSRHQALSQEEGGPGAGRIKKESSFSEEEYKVSKDDFTLIRVIGKGSFAKVLLVRKKDTGELFAMKVLSKPNVVKRKQVEHTRTERVVLGVIDHPFIARMHYAFQTDSKLYFILEYCPGGEVFFHLSRQRTFPESTARVFAAELVLALHYLHGLGIAYRDLKPENVLLDVDGHVKLTDFGLAKNGVAEPNRGAQSLCGTPEYLAPEVINRSGHGTAVDWWGLGMVLYEMITGLPPWYTRDKKVLFMRLRSAALTFPPHVSPEARGLIAGLLDRDPSTRLGVDHATSSCDEGKGGGIARLRAHPFFAAIDWDELLAKRVPAPFDPCFNAPPGDASAPNVEGSFARMPVESNAEGGAPLREQDPLTPPQMFSGFTFNEESPLSIPEERAVEVDSQVDSQG